MAKLVGWRFGVFIGSIVGAITLAIYPIGIHPYLHPEKWQDIQKQTREGIRQEDIQPGGMKVWSDPFDRKK
jgi:phosphotransferase system  glucose/maltose/N-acetylglucosamine-specific IIC component